MSKSTPINQVLNNNPTLVDDILNDMGQNTKTENIEERQQMEQKLLEEGMERQILEQKQNEEAYEPQEEAYEPQEEAYEPQEEAYEPQEEASDPQEDNISMDSPNESTALNTTSFNKSAIPDSKKGKESKEKGLMERLYDNIKPTLIVVVLTLCVLSNISTQFIDKLLPNKDIFIKYNILIVLILKSLLSGSVFFISNLLL